MLAHGFENCTFWLLQKIVLNPLLISREINIIAHMLANESLTAGKVVLEDIGKIPMGPESATFEQKPWAIAHGFEDGGFG